MDTEQLHKAQTALSFMYIIGRAVRGKKPFVKSVNSLQSGNKMKEGFFMNCHKEGYFASFLTFSYCKKLFWSQKQDMVAKKNSGIREAGNESNVGEKNIREGGKKAIMVTIFRKGDKKAILVKIIKEVSKKKQFWS